MIGKDTTSKRAASSVRDPSLPNDDRSDGNVPRGTREGSHLSSQMGRGYKNGRQSDFGFEDRFGHQLMDDGAMFDDGQQHHEDFNYDALEGEQYGDFTSKSPTISR